LFLLFGGRGVFSSRRSLDGESGYVCGSDSAYEAERGTVVLAMAGIAGDVVWLKLANNDLDE
jgi:hypothetical protein